MGSGVSEVTGNDSMRIYSFELNREGTFQRNQKPCYAIEESDMRKHELFCPNCLYHTIPMSNQSLSFNALTLTAPKLERVRMFNPTMAWELKFSDSF